MSLEQTIDARPPQYSGLAPWVDATGWCVHVTVTYAGQERSSAVIAAKDHEAACAAYVAAVEAARARGWSGYP